MWLAADPTSPRSSFKILRILEPRGWPTDYAAQPVRFPAGPSQSPKPSPFAPDEVDGTESYRMKEKVMPANDLGQNTSTQEDWDRHQYPDVFAVLADPKYLGTDWD